MAILLIVLGNIAIVALGLQIFTISHDIKFCHFVMYGGLPIYNSFRAVSYCIMIIRLDEGFNASPFGYSRRKLIAWFCILIIWCIFNIILGNITSTVSLTLLYGDHYYCNIHFANTMTSIGSVLLLDITAGIINIYLFITPLKKVSRAVKEANTEIVRGGQIETGHIDKFRNTALKQLRLALSSILSTILLLGLTSVFGFSQIFIPLDIIITTSSILLMYSWYSNIANKLCCIKKDSVAMAKNIEITGIVSDEPSREENL